MNVSALQQLEQWLSLSETEQDDIVKQLEQVFQGEYIHQYTLSYTNNPSFRIATFQHRLTELEFNLIIGGQFNMGLSVQEEEAFRDLVHRDGLEEDYFFSFIDMMKPAHQVRVRPFLMSRLPILNSFTREHLEFDIDEYISNYEVDDDWEEKLLPASLTREQVNVLMEKFNFSLPSEAQWEYAYRGGTATLFYWGNDLCIDEDKFAICEFSNPEICRKAANPFGLVGMLVGEWCEDSYYPDYSQASDQDLPLIGRSSYVVRGGAARLSPWQGCGEWLTCVSAMRLWEDDTPESELYSGRFVKVIDIETMKDNH